MKIVARYSVVTAFLFILAGCAAAHTVKEHSLYRSEKYAFALRYPAEYSVLSDSISEVSSVDDGEATDDWDEVLFGVSDQPLFGIRMFPAQQNKLTEQYPFDGTCGPQLTGKSVINRTAKIGNLDVLERRHEYEMNKTDIDYCFVSANGSLIDLFARDVKTSDADSIDALLQSAVRTVR